MLFYFRNINLEAPTDVIGSYSLPNGWGHDGFAPAGSESHENPVLKNAHEISRQRDKARSTQNNFPSSSLLSANESSLFNPIGYGRHVTSKPSVNAEDEEFEANTLSMKLQKPVAYVANAESDGRSKRLVGACLYNICATCSAALQTSSNKCLNCRKFMDREINGEHVGQGDVSQKTANLSTATSPFDASCVEAVDYNLDPGCALTQSSIQILDSASARLRADVLPEKLFNAASMMHLLHPK